MSMPPELLTLAELQATTGKAPGTRPSPPPQDQVGAMTPGPRTARAGQASSRAGSRSRPPPSRNQEQDSGPRRHHRAAPEASGARQPAHSRLGPRIEPADARDRLDRLVESRIAEEEAPAGPKCFGPRIANEPTLEGFTLPRDTPKYDGTAKPEDWLQDYSTAVGIAKGNKRWAVRYSPLMLVGSARTWLNNLPAGSINGWLDFEAAFISNFTGTYRRPGRPQQLEMCKQGPDETDRAYLTRCDPKSMAALMAIADWAHWQRKPARRRLTFHRLQRRDNNRPAEHKPAEGGSHGSRRDNYRGKRHSDQPDRRYGSAHVAAVADNAARQPPPEARPAVEAEVHLEQMLDVQIPQRQEPLQPHHPRLPLHEAADKR
ncbi:hypothetical protein QYE76_030320 [Lolium multiflorum]|uniref:Retrotransposon gag domain-containing protein n=1 Tax=Lolium multiflorum TaxID=4521 RepID=A0AAD8VGD5_LOLMU|nr:hypothetical protein QYE76_030320 [Lolium multiflorum]